MFGLGFLDAAAAILKKIVQGVVDVIVFLFTHPAFLAAVIIAILGAYFYIKNAHHIHVLEQEIIGYEKEKIFWTQSTAIYESNIRLLNQVEKENSATLKSLQLINIDALRAKKNLEEVNKTSKQKINNLVEYIKKAPATDNAALAPVLKNTVEEIDKIRAERNGLWGNK